MGIELAQAEGELPLRIEIGETPLQYYFSAGLKPAKMSLQAVPEYSSDTILQRVTFSGQVTDFQGHIRNLVRVEGTTTDTLLRQKMKLQFITSSIEPRPADTMFSKNYLYNHLEIPFWQFEGYSDGDSSLLDNPNVDYDPDTRTVVVDDLVWNAEHATPGKYVLCAAIENIDFVVEDEDGNTVVLPDSSEAEAVFFRENPIVLPSDTTVDDTIVVTVICTTSIEKPTGFTATGSEADTNWAGEDESRKIFVRWDSDDNPALHGYEIAWYPSSDTKGELKRTALVGKTDHYEITVPDISPFFTDSCENAAGEVAVTIDTTIYLDTFST